MTIGSDLSGSLRIPAHFCGVYGHKPSLDLVSVAGFQPGPWDGSPGFPMDLSVAGPLARSARDLELALSVLGGADDDEAKAWTCATHFLEEFPSDGYAESILHDKSDDAFTARLVESFAAEYDDGSLDGGASAAPGGGA
jgi:Asp-tRNA(Asn)/Glu-tRNA(Gln) amidotransferase A subunit family amidase